MTITDAADFKGTQTDKAQNQSDATTSQNAQNEVNQSRAAGNTATVDNTSNTSALVAKGVLPSLSIDMNAAPESAASLPATPTTDSSASSTAAAIKDSGTATASDSTASGSQLPQGSKQVTNADGVTVTTDKNGLLSQTTTADGATRTFQRDDHGNLQGIINPDGSSLKSDSSGWSLYDAAGAKIGATSQYQPQTNADGSFTVTAEDGSVTNYKTDGTGQAKNQDGSTVDINNHGDVSKVTYPGGSNRTFTYDNGNDLTSFTDANGKTYADNKGAFTASDGSTISGTPNMSPDGTLQIDRSDGSSTTYDTNGAAVTADSSGNVSQVQYADGTQRQFGRDAGGNINSITETDGSTWSQQADGTWNQYDKTGKATGNTNTATASVDNDGNYTLKNADGTSETRRTDRSTIKSDKNDNVTEIDYANGKNRQFSYDSAGKLTTETDENGAVARKQKDGSWKGDNGNQPVQVQSDGTVTSWNDGVYSKTSSDDLTTTPRIGDNLYGTHSDDPLQSITPDAVHQGDLGDCYFLAGVAAVAKSNPQSIQDMIHDNGNGSYTVTFPGDDNHPQTVAAPTATELERYAADDGTNGTWVAVLEKAHRQLTGNETSDPGGQSATGLNLLLPKGTSVPTGIFDSWEELSPGNVSLNHKSLADTDKILTDAMQNNKAVVAGTGSDNWVIQHTGASNDPGSLVDQHEYAVTGYDPASEAVTLRNPWGQTGQDGTFTLSLQDFHDHFSDIAYQN